MAIKWAFWFFFCLLKCCICRGQDGTASMTSSPVEELRRNPSHGTCRCQKELDEDDNLYFGETEVSFEGCGHRPPGEDTPGDMKNLQENQETVDNTTGQPLKPVDRITQPHTWPWVVAFIVKGTNGKMISFCFCQGSLISNTYVLASASCLYNIIHTLSNWKDLLYIEASPFEPNRAKYKIEKILYHPQFKSPRYYNDICLVKTKEPVTLNSRVFPVCLPSPSKQHLLQQRKKVVIVKGWNQTINLRTFEEKQSVFVREESLLPQDPCYVMIQLHEISKPVYWLSFSLRMPQGLNDQIMCTKFKARDEDCLHAGGPMTVQLKDSSYVLLGIALPEHYVKGLPRLFLKISKYTKWIKENSDL